jgi:hypothetical protein
VQIAHRFDDSFVAQMLRLFVEDDGRFQIRPEAAFDFQAFGQDAAIERLTMRTSSAMLSRFNAVAFQ